MLAKVRTSTLNGLEAVAVEVEVRVKQGTPCFNIIGLADNAVRESRDRVFSAITHAGFQLPQQILVNLAPAEIKKEGAGFDLPIALGILGASGQIDAGTVARTAVHGELSLSGELKPIRGTIAFTICALQDGMQHIIVPRHNAREAGLISGIGVTAVKSLPELVQHLRGEALIPPGQARATLPRRRQVLRHISDVVGQQAAKRAMLIAAAGAHNLLFIGPPGCGKSMLAERFSAVLPPLSRDEMLEVVKIHSIAGLPIEGLLSGERPFRSPHHIVSDAGLLGGGSYPRPGEISLAHFGVLFLDEFPEFRRSAIEALRSPLESGCVQVARARSSVKFPADFQLVAAMNPCPCGKLGAQNLSCNCGRAAVQKYLSKLSQPILDRIDLHVELEPVPFELMTNAEHSACGGSDEAWSEQVSAARERQMKRQVVLNSRLGSEQISRCLKLDAQSLRLLEAAAVKIGLSARGYFKILRVAMTIADLDGEGRVGTRQIAEAIGFRSLERIKQYCEAG